MSIKKIFDIIEITKAGKNICYYSNNIKETVKMSQFLKTGVAYHGNRMPSHAREDMKEIVDADMDIVVHMFSHMDWDRHSYAMKDIIAMSEDMGLEVWVDNWGIGGRPGDVSHYLSMHPEDHMIYGNGDRDPYQICLHSEEYRKFVKRWLDTVKSIGGTLSERLDRTAWQKLIEHKQNSGLYE